MVKLYHFGLIICLAFLITQCIRKHETKSYENIKTKTELKHQIDSLYHISDESNYIKAQLNLAAIYKQSDSLPQWLYCYDRIIKISRDSIALDTALIYYKKMLDGIWKTPDDTASLNKLAWIHRQIAFEYGPHLEQWRLSVGYYEQGIALINKANTWTPDKAIKFLKACGSGYTRLGEPQNAIDYLQKSYEICLQFQDTLSMIKSLNDLGLAQQDIGKTKEAEEIYLQAIKLNEPVKYKEEKIGSLSKLISLYTDSLETEKAKKLLTDLRVLIFDTDTEADDIASYYMKKAAVNEVEKKYQEAVNNYQQAIKYFEISKENRRRNISKAEIAVGNVYLHQKKISWAIDAFHTSLINILTQYKETDASIVPPENLLYPENIILEACEGKGDAYMQVYAESKDKRKLQYAKAFYETALKVQDLLIKQSELESSKIQLGKKSESLEEKYQRASALLMNF